MPTPTKMGCAVKPETNLVQEESKIQETIKSQVMEERNMITVGKKAPDFTAKAFYNGEFVDVSLSEYAGKWTVLCFYPGDFTFVWATEISAVADAYAEFEKLGVQVLSVSIDSVFTHKMWNDNEISKMINKDIPFPMLSDPDGAIGKMYGVYDLDGKVETRGRFIIDPDGNVQAYEVLTPPVGRNLCETLRQIQAFQYVREHNGTEATPAGWVPGKKTLKPSPALVGNVWKEWSVSEAKNK